MEKDIYYLVGQNIKREFDSFEIKKSLKAL